MCDNHTFDKNEVIRRLEYYLGKTFGEIDNRGLFDNVQQHALQKGIAGHVVEQCVFEYSPDTRQEADLVLIDGNEERRTELKTTGMVIKRNPRNHYEAKEPMSITAVGVYDIGEQEFFSSHFWEKIENMLIIYYHYAATRRGVTAYEYKDFPVVGYEFHSFSEGEIETLRTDWELVRNLCAEVVSRHPGNRTREWKQAVKEDYIESRGPLRRQLSYIDLAPKFPPRFRLKQPTVSTIIANHFGYNLEQLPERYITIQDIDRQCHEITSRYAGKTVGELADLFGIPRTTSNGRENKGITEQIAVKMFGGDSKKLNRLEIIQRFGLVAKTVVLTANGGRTEDTKLYHIDFDELLQTTITEEDGTNREYEFSDSAMYSFFTNNEFLCILYKEPDVNYGEQHSLADNTFVGFKRLVFSDEFIEADVQRLWTDTRTKINNHTLVDVVRYDNNGRPKRNQSGDISSAPNFLKSRENTVFIRGSATNSSLRYKTERVNNISMLPQYVWIKGKSIIEQLNEITLL